MTAGRPAKPVELKKKQGTYRKDRDRSLETGYVIPFVPVEDVPDVPADLQVEGQKLWVAIWEAGASWINPACDMFLVEQVARLKDLAVVAGNRALVTTDPGDVRAAIQANEAVNKTLASLGFSPSDRAKLGVQQAQAVSTLEKLRKKSG